MAILQRIDTAPDLADRVYRQLLDAICQVTSVSEKFAGPPVATRATQLPSPDVDSDFLKVFGQPARETACACERSTDSNLSQALQMINGPLVHAKVRDEKNRRPLAVGRAIMEALVAEARASGLSEALALTRKPAFFLKLGFVPSEKEHFPLKVWADCARCPRQNCCDEVAVVLKL